MLVVLSGRPPRWIDRICHYNPTSVLWRYFVILDRRVRSHKWTAEDMAASNAYFWTGHSWDTGEEMMILSRERLIHRPSSCVFLRGMPTELCTLTREHSTHVDLLSYSAIQTLVVALQGAQSLYYIIASSVISSEEYIYANRLNLANILQPFALFGLLRLPAAPWLSQTYSYHYLDDPDVLLPNQDSQPKEVISGVTYVAHGNYLRPPHGALGLTTRFLFPVPLLALAGYTVYWLVPYDRGIVVSLQGSAAFFAHLIFFAAFLILTVMIFAVHFVHGSSTTTVIPCHDAVWYKVYTIALFVGMLVLVVIAALESRKTWCGTWTTTVWLSQDPCPNPGNVRFL